MLGMEVMDAEAPRLRALPAPRDFIRIRGAPIVHGNRGYRGEFLRSIFRGWHPGIITRNARLFQELGRKYDWALEKVLQRK